MQLITILGGLAGSNLLLVFTYQLYVVTTLGPGIETDALFAAMVIPQLVLAVVSGSMSNVLVPLLTIEKERNFNQEAWSIFQGIGLLFGSISILLLFTAHVWVPLTVPGFDFNVKLLTISLARIQLVGMVFTALTAVLWSAYHARQKFIWVELSATLANIIGLGLLLWALPRFGVFGAAWTIVFRTFLQTIFLIPGIGAYHKPNWRTKSVKEAWLRLRPLLIGTTYYKTDQLVDRILSSMTMSGGLSLIHLSQQIYSTVNQIINRGVVAPMVPLLAQKAHSGDWQSFKHISQKRLLWVAGITSAGFLFLLVIGQPLLTILFGHKRFQVNEIVTLWRLLVSLVGVLIGGTMGQVFSASFYAKGDTKLPTQIGAFGFTIGICFKIVGFYLWGLIGIALGTTLYYFVNVFLLYFFLTRLIRERILNEYVGDQS